MRVHKSSNAIVNLPTWQIMFGKISRFRGKRAVKLFTDDNVYWDVNPQYVKEFSKLYKN